MADDGQPEDAAQRLKHVFPGVQFAPHALQKLESFQNAPSLEVQSDAFEEWLVESFDIWDPVGLMNSTYSQNREYIAEARLIRSAIENCETIKDAAKAIAEIFHRQFSSELPLQRSKWMAERIFKAWTQFLSERRNR